MPHPDWVPGNPNDRSITGFRIRNGSGSGPMSRTLYYKLKKEGRGPRETFITPTRIMITAADEAAWQHRCATPTDTEAKLIAKAAAFRVARNKRAVAASLAGPRHVSKQGRRKKSAQAAA